MVRLLKTYWWVFPVALMAGLTTFTAWVLGTSSGARWGIATLSAHTPVKINAENIEGRLIDRLTFHKPAVSFPGGGAQAARFDMEWRPIHLFIGRLSFSSISGSNLHISLPETARQKSVKPVQTWPRVTGLLVKLHAEVDQLDLKNISVSRGKKQALVVEQVGCRLTWRTGILSVSRLSAKAPSWNAGGEVAAGFLRPSLSADFKVNILQKTAPVKSVALTLQGREAARRGLISGTFTTEIATYRMGNEHATGNFLLLRDGISLSGLSITSSKIPGKVTGDAESHFTPSGIAANGNLRLQRVNFGKVSTVQTNLTGNISVKWHQGSYQGNFSLADKAGKRPRLSASAFYQGDSHGLVLKNIKGGIAEGRVFGNATVNWAQGVKATMKLDVAELDPAAFYPSWPGKIAAGIDASIIVPPKTSPTVAFKVDFKPSELRDRYFRGDASGSYSNKDITLSQLRIFGDSFTLAANGTLSERIDFTVALSRIEAFAPNAGGSITAEGWLKRVEGDWFGAMNGSGKSLSYGNMALQSASFHLYREQSVEKPFAVDIRGKLANYGDFKADSTIIFFSGTPVSHQGSISTTWHDGSADLRLAGSYAADAWTGTISTLTYRKSDVGSWHAVAPFVASISGRHAALSPFELVSIAGERVKGSLALSLAPLRGQAELSWQQVDLSDANPFVDNFLLAGQTSGALEIGWPEGGRLNIAGWSEAAGRIALEFQDIRILQALTEFDWDRKGLQGRAGVTLADGGHFTSTFSSDQGARLALPSKASFHLDWDDFNLGILQPWMHSVSLVGISSGRVRGSWWENGRLDLAALASATAVVGYEGASANIQSLETEIDWDQHGLHTHLQAFLGGGGEIEGNLSSREPSRLQLPKDGEASLTWKGINVALLKKWIPEHVNITGTVSGKTSAKIVADGRFEVEGASAVDNGSVAWETDSGKLSAALRQADLKWSWQNSALKGSTSILLQDYGKVDGKFTLPATARLPVAMDEEGPVSVVLQSTVKETGLLSAILPGLVDETRGNVVVEVDVGGTWSSPKFGGQIQLQEAAASVPVAGIRITDTTLSAHLDGDTIYVDSFSAKSGPGKLWGTGQLQLQGFKISDYSMSLQGDKFQVIYLPELRLQASPNLQLSGNPDKLTVRGDITIPELLVLGRQGKGPVQASADVIIVDAPQPPDHQLPIALDLQVRVLFGDRVLIQAYGIDAKLGGGVLVKASGINDITGQGEIKVEKGTYSTYGVKLDITHGSLIFAGGTIEEPTLDILALRTIKEAQVTTGEETTIRPEVVKAGVQITGTTAAPVIKLYSEPAMPDTDILAYIVLGHPLGQDPAQADLLMLAAGALLSKGESVVLQERLKKTLGLDVLEIQSGGSAMAQSIVTVGKYLSPRLYISYGRYLFTGINEFRLRYTISRHWEVQSRSGLETGVDLYYRIQFR